MRTTSILMLLSVFTFLGLVIYPILSMGQQNKENPDEKVQKFLNAQKDSWQNWNVSYEDGKVLYDLIVKNNYKRALEIGTSTGHSTIWMAWALSKTGGKIITIEIDEGRHRQALKNFEEAGVSKYIDARLADAHQLVKELEGPFDFVFSDADKEWYKNYFVDIEPKLIVGGCFTAHNVSDLRSQAKEFLDYIKSLPNFETTIARQNQAGISVSYKKAGK